MSTEFRWYQPQTPREAADAIENVKAIVRFLCDNLTQEGFKPGYSYSLTEEGVNGLYQIYSLIEDVLDVSNTILVKEVRA
ncbi:MAG: hypothetical protein C4560_03020 [Nitrospiraceae bacterium]|nr:MAG: hypothetical protein C4560_03020 [Nitrospiraceae bacterium]